MPTIQCKLPYLSFINEGSYVFTAANPQSDVSRPVTLSVGRLTPVLSGVVNNASHLSGPLAPGELVQITGTNFGPQAQVAVTIGGVNAPVLSSSDSLATVVVPLQATSA